GGSGNDVLNGGAGDDVIFFDLGDNDFINGGIGTDTVKITDTGMIDFSNASINNMEVIDIADNQAQTLNLSVTDVLEMTDTHHTLFVNADSNDSLQLTGLQKVDNAGTMSEDGYAMYTDTGSNMANAFVYVSDDVVL
ncbi:MAG: hypothetical protein KGV51_02915, partial [Moraxellaceae bacterium]|nr:hypothetical protein [Moraxellaceae bacterium]